MSRSRLINLRLARAQEQRSTGILGVAVAGPNRGSKEGVDLEDGDVIVVGSSNNGTPTNGGATYKSTAPGRDEFN